MESNSTDVGLSVSLRYWADNSILGFDEPEDFVLTVNGEILGCSHSETDTELDCKVVRLGKFKLYRIQLSKAMEYEETAGFICDAYQETMDAGSAVFDFATNDFSPSVLKKFSDLDLFDDILLISHLTIYPVARGNRLGLAAIVQMIQDWSKGCSLIMIKPFPLQFEAGPPETEDRRQLELEKFPTSKKIAFTHLRNYYRRLGFKQVGRSDFYVLSPGGKLPSARKLGFSNFIHVPMNFLESAEAVIAK